MKKLFKLFIPVLTLFSLFLSSCDKEEQEEVYTPHFVIKHTYTTQNGGSGSGSGDITNGIVNAVYVLDPYLHGDICKNGQWSYTVTPNPKGAWFFATQDPKTGKVSIKFGSSPATYTVTITYTCPDGTSYSATITVTT